MTDLLARRDLPKSGNRSTKLSLHERERIIVEGFKSALREVGGGYVAEFKFRNKEIDRTSHYIFHITKNASGHKIMKEIMYGLSTDNREVRRAEFAPPLTPQLSLFPDGWEELESAYVASAEEIAAGRSCRAEPVGWGGLSPVFRRRISLYCQERQVGFREAWKPRGWFWLTRLCRHECEMGSQL